MGQVLVRDRVICHNDTADLLDAVLVSAKTQYLRAVGIDQSGQDVRPEVDSATYNIRAQEADV